MSSIEKSPGRMSWECFSRDEKFHSCREKGSKEGKFAHPKFAGSSKGYLTSNSWYLLCNFHSLPIGKGLLASASDDHSVIIWASAGPQLCFRASGLSLIPADKRIYGFDPGVHMEA